MTSLVPIASLVTQHVKHLFRAVLWVFSALISHFLKREEEWCSVFPQLSGTSSRPNKSEGAAKMCIFVFNGLKSTASGDLSTPLYFY